MMLLTNKELDDLASNVNFVNSKEFLTRHDKFYLCFAQKLLEDNTKRTERKHFKLIKGGKP